MHTTVHAISLSCLSPLTPLPLACSGAVPPAQTAALLAAQPAQHARPSHPAQAIAFTETQRRATSNRKPLSSAHSPRLPSAPDRPPPAAPWHAETIAHRAPGWPWPGPHPPRHPPCASCFGQHWARARRRPPPCQLRVGGGRSPPTTTSREPPPCPSPCPGCGDAPLVQTLYQGGLGGGANHCRALARRPASRRAGRARARGVAARRACSRGAAGGAGAPRAPPPPP
jgi:hypothetical protein